MEIYKAINPIERASSVERNATYSVWVGGVEVNDYELTKKEAESLAKEYRNDGYDDVQVAKN